MIAFAEIHPGWFAVIAIAVECAIIFGLLALLPRIAMNEPPEWVRWEVGAVSCEFHIGQKVVCVDASMPAAYQWDDCDDVPVEGRVYTITGIMPTNFPAYASHELIFAEIRRCDLALIQRPPVYGYGSRRFRPLDDSRYDISIFQQMCVDARDHAGAPR